MTKTVQPQVATTYVQYTTPAAGSVVSQAAAGGYCSTLYAVGPGLPTTRQGSCGTILVTSGGGSLRRRGGQGAGRLWLSAVVGVLLGLL